MSSGARLLNAVRLNARRVGSLARSASSTSGGQRGGHLHWSRAASTRTKRCGSALAQSTHRGGAAR